MDWIIMNDGTKYNGTIGYVNGVIWCYLPDKTISQVYPDFADKEKTKHLVSKYVLEEFEYDGFTELSLIMQDENQVKIMLRKEGANV